MLTTTVGRSVGRARSLSEQWAKRKTERRKSEQQTVRGSSERGKEGRKEKDETCGCSCDEKYTQPAARGRTGSNSKFADEKERSSIFLRLLNTANLWQHLAFIFSSVLRQEILLEIEQKMRGN